MGKNKGTKKLRGSRGARIVHGMDNTTRSRPACDLMVLLPKSTSKLKFQLLVKEIGDRLTKIGFTHMALTHTIYGRPKPNEDSANVAIPTSLWDFESTNTDLSTTNNKGETSTSSSSKKRKLNEPFIFNGIRILRRIHAIVENLADVGIYLANGPYAELLNEYDIVSISPTSDATFQSACANATMADIITLDYTSRGLRLPYRIRSIDVKAVVERGATFEIPISPALLNLKQRKNLIHACRELRNNSLGLKLRIIISSGDRVLEGTDVGALALRTPGDLTNLCKTIMQFDDSIATNALGETPMQVIRRGEERRFGKTEISSVNLLNKQDLLSASSEKNASDIPMQKDPIAVRGGRKSEGKNDLSYEQNDDSSDGDHGDGFIAM